MFKARVVAVHPESHSCDIVIMDDGRRFSGVQILSSMAGGNVGSVDLPTPSVTDPQKPFDSSNTGIRDVYCLVEFISRDIPIILGFIYPQVNQCAFSASDFRVNRHASDVYNTVSATGDIELHHPSGTFLRIAENPAHVDLTELDYDKKWKLAANLDTLPNICVVVANVNGTQATINISPTGNISITNAGTTTVNSSGEVSITAPNVVIDSTVHIKKAVVVDADVTAFGVSLIHHIHNLTQPGTGNSGQPV